MILISNTKLKYKAELIVSTSNMIMSQVKFLLDKNLLDQKVFQPQLQKHKIKKVVKDAAQIMKAQATMKKINIEVKFGGDDYELMID